jgi:hypothetical protein
MLGEKEDRDRCSETAERLKSAARLAGSGAFGGRTGEKEAKDLSAANRASVRGGVRRNSLVAQGAMTGTLKVADASASGAAEWQGSDMSETGAQPAPAQRTAQRGPSRREARSCKHTSTPKMDCVRTILLRAIEEMYGLGERASIVGLNRIFRTCCGRRSD